MELLLATTALSGGLSFLSGQGQRNSTKAQNNAQMWLDTQHNIINAARMDDVNRRREALGREMLTVEEKETVSTSNKQSSAIDIDAFMAAGEKAGFNPVTWLNSGALSLYATQSSENSVSTTRQGHNAADAFKLMAPDMVTSATTQLQRVPSAGEVIGNAGTAALSNFNNGLKTLNQQDYQNQLLQAQIQSLSGRTGTQSGNNASSGLAGSIVTRGGASSGSAALSLGSNWNPTPSVVSGLAYPSKWTQGDVKVTNPGFDWKLTPGWSDASAWEEAYADVGSNTYAVIKGINDIGLNLTGTSTYQGVQNFLNTGSWSGTPGTESVRSIMERRGLVIN